MVDKQYIRLNLSIGKAFSYLEYHTDSIIKANSPDIYFTEYSFIRKIEIDNQQDVDYSDLVIHMEFTNTMFHGEDFHTGEIRRREKSVLQVDPKIRVDGEKLYALSTVESCAVVVSLLDPNDGNKTVFTITKNVKILPLTQASSDFYKAPLLFSEYCVTDFADLIRIQHAACAEKAKVNGVTSDCLVGYQNSDVNDVVKEISCIYKAIHNEGNVTYSNPPNSTEILQNIRMPQTVLKTKLGTCLDLSLLFCSALLQVSLHPLLIILEGHAFVGCFLHEYDSFNGLVENRPSVVYSDAVSEDRNLILFECTSVVNSSSASFAEAVSIATESLRAYRGMFFAIDVYRAQCSFFKPIPIADDSGTIDFSIPKFPLRDVELEDITKFQGTPIPESDYSDRFSTWEKKLLDLSTANRLVNFRFTKDRSNYCQVIPPHGKGKGIFEFLKECDGNISLLNFQNTGITNAGKTLAIDDRMILSVADSRLKEKTLIFTSNDKTVKSLIKKDSESREETGSPTLYLGIGLLKGEDTNAHGSKEIQGPFLLLPVRISKDRYGDKFSCSYDMEELMVNKTFFEYYKSKKGSDYDNLYSVSCHNSFDDIVATLRNNHSGDIQLDENFCFLANFLFTHMVMWQDIVDRQDVLRQNVVIRSLLENRSFINDEPLKYDNVDELDHMDDFAAPLPYDSTQLRAIQECAKGNSFILDGPPGTGKSQTIVNMIVNAFYHGKTVLFVAEKQAALEVVRQRLATLGVDRFALQLYSSKTNKQAFFSQLSKAMDYGQKSSDEDFKSVLDEIRKEKEEINGELRRLHSHKKYFYSLYESITKELATSDIKSSIVLSPEFLNGYDMEKNDLVRNTLHHIRRTNQEFDGSEEEAFLPVIGFNQYSYVDQTKTEQMFSKLFPKLDDVEKSYHSFLGMLGIQLNPSSQDFRFLLDLLSILLYEEVRVECFSKPDLSSYFKNMDQVMDDLASLAKIENSICHLYDLVSIEKVDGNKVREALKKGTNFFNRRRARKEAMKLLSPMILDKDRELSNEEIIKASEIADEYNHWKRIAIKNKFALLDFFQEPVLDSLQSYDHYRKVYESTEKLYRLVDSGNVGLFENLYTVSKTVAPLKLSSVRKAFEDLKSSYGVYSNSLQEIEKSYPLNTEVMDRWDFFRSQHVLCTLFTDERNQYKVDQYIKLKSDFSILNQMGLEEFVNQIKSSEIVPDEMERTFEHILCHSFVIHDFVMDDNNNEFDSKKYEEQIKKYQELIQRYNTLCMGETIERITSRFFDPELKRMSTTPIGALRKLCMNSGKGISIRNTLSKFEDLIRMYFPCFLMSPLAAAQYLDVNSKKFDIVIFDEASQIPTSEAVGPIARGNSLIVAGDPQQMPPSDYFSVSMDQDGDDLAGEGLLSSDAESLLDDALAIDMPRIRLAFHYRSKHESLIRFSNSNFYGGDLFTFPSPDNLTSHISFIHVDPKSKTKGSDLSAEEVQAILEVLKNILDNPKTNHKSIGIIVFNSLQKEKLEDEVDGFLNRNREYLSLTHWNEEDSTKKLFVKNLENVQGDERDIIIMSIGFLKGNDGKAIINGPLSLPKGERRLNVAASRSIEQMIVISTIYAGDIDETGRKNLGAKNLKDFLSFAQNSTAFVQNETNSSPNKDLAYFISKELKEKGYECDVAVGSSEFKVDLAVRRKGQSTYLLGILLDEKPLNSNVSCRDRFYVEPVMLANLKWKILRVFTIPFLRYRSRTIKAIIDAIESLEKEKEETANTDLYVPPVMVGHHVTREDFAIVDYEKLDFMDSVKGFPLELDAGTYYPPLKEFLSGLLNKEYPISKNRILELSKQWLGVLRMSQKTITLVLSHLNSLQPEKTEDYDGSVFYWPSGAELKVSHFRASDRDILDIAKEEIVALMNPIIRIYHDIDKEELIRITAMQMSIQILTNKVRNKLAYVLNDANENNLLEEGYHENSGYQMAS